MGRLPETCGFDYPTLKKEERIFNKFHLMRRRETHNNGGLKKRPSILEDIRLKVFNMRKVLRRKRCMKNRGSDRPSSHSKREKE